MSDTHLIRRTVVAYVPHNEKFLPEIEEALEALRRKSLLTTWLMRNVESEQDPLLDADIVLLLISPAFIKSPFFLQTEEDLLKKHEEGSLCVIPILLHYTLWYDRPLARLATLPPDGLGGAKPLAEWKNRGIAHEHMREGIIPIVAVFEQAQLTRQLLLLQEISKGIAQQRLDKLIEQGLSESLFALCDRLHPLLSEQMAHILDQLAEVTQDGQQEFSRHCSERVAALRTGSQKS